MAKYISRSCPKCRDYLWLVVSQTPKSDGEYPINAFCAVCGYKLKGWRLIAGRKPPGKAFHGRMSKVFG
jgi:hypothetical protein